MDINLPLRLYEVLRMDKKVIKIVGVVLLVLIIVVIGYGFLNKGENDNFNRQNVEKLSNLKVVPSLEKDYDTAEVQVRHLTWGKLNYYPEEIKVKAGKKVHIVGDLKRLQGCFRTIVIPQFKINGQFTEANNVVEFMPTESGTFEFGCAMGMGKGTLIVE